MSYRILSLIVSLIVLAFSALGAEAADSKKCCATDCKQCEKVCADTLAYFKKKGGSYATAKNLKVLKDCIAACKKAESGKAEDCCANCVSACQKCADMCAEQKDPKLADCIKACNDCAAACK